MPIRTFEINLSAEDVFFFQDGRTIFIGTIDRSLNDILDLRKKIFPCNAILILNKKDIEIFPLHFEPFARNPEQPEIKSFGTHKQLSTQKDIIRQSIANNECMIRMNISFEDE